MYGLVTIWLAALMASTTCCGASIGGIAMPFTILPLGAGWNCGSLGEVPPVGVPGAGVVVVVSDPPEVFDDWAKTPAGSKQAQARASTASKSVLLARFGNVSFVRLPS